MRFECDTSLRVCPPLEDVFYAFTLLKPEDVRVIILGQDPYHGQGEAHGLAFSVCQGISPPPSLRNIFKELQSDLGIKRVRTDLSDWAKQGVLLLNTVLTVYQDQAASHQKWGWEHITEHVLCRLLSHQQPRVLVLWGKWAKRFANYAKPERHLCLSTPHPSPLSAYRGFLGSRIFSKINHFLIQQGQDPIHWGN